MSRLSVVLTFSFRKEGRLWAGECLELGTATDGRRLEKVYQELSNLVVLHLNALQDIGEADRVLALAGDAAGVPLLGLPGDNGGQEERA
jgi:hypothetical protein